MLRFVITAVTFVKSAIFSVFLFIRTDQALEDGDTSRDGIYPGAGNALNGRSEVFPDATSAPIAMPPENPY